MVIVSRYAKPGYTDTTTTTFASLLAYTEHTFGLTPLSSSDSNAYDFAHAFNYLQTPLAPPRSPAPPSQPLSSAGSLKHPGNCGGSQTGRRALGEGRMLGYVETTEVSSGAA
jgi:hypothetical protein